MKVKHKRVLMQQTNVDSFLWSYTCTQQHILNIISLKDSNTLESFIVFLISVLSLLLLKDSDFIGIFYCFSNFGTILIIIIKRVGIFYCFSNFGTILIILFSGQTIGIANLRNRDTFSHQIPLIYRPLSDDVQCAFWYWSRLPFWIQSQIRIFRLS